MQTIVALNAISAPSCNSSNRRAPRRLLEVVEKGLMDAEDPALREKPLGLKLRRDELAREVTDLHRHMSSGEPQITPEKIGKLIVLLRDKLTHGPSELRQAYARLIMQEVRVTDDEIRISGSRAVLARCAAAEEIPATLAVLSFVQEWRARRDSNS